MSLGPILQIIGIALTATGTILTLSKLWQRYFEESKKWAEFYTWFLKEYIKSDDIIREKDSKWLKEVLESETFHPSYKKGMGKLIKSRFKYSKRTKNRIKKDILKLLRQDQYFLKIGVSLIILGAFIQVIGVLS